MTEGRRGLVSILLATYNEAENVQLMIGRVLEQVGDPVEVVVIDDDSPDRTWEIAERIADPRVRVVRRIGERGLASAIHRGIREAQGEFVGWMDVDMLDQVIYLPALLDRMSDCEVAVASRFVGGGADERGWLLVLASRLVNGLALLVLGGGIRDYDSGFVMVRREVFERASFTPVGFGEYFIEFLYRCRRAGLRICEVPYTLTERSAGGSKSAPNIWRFFLQGMGYVFRIFKTRLGSVK